MNKMASTEVNNLFSVKGRVALVTGGTTGIGLMIAKVSSISEKSEDPELILTGGWWRTARKSTFAGYPVTQSWKQYMN
jgi:hypothetical protein